MKHFDTTEMNVIKNGNYFLSDFDMNAKQTNFQNPKWTQDFNEAIRFPETYAAGTSDDAWAVAEQLQNSMLTAELEVKQIHVTYETRVTDIEEVEE